MLNEVKNIKENANKVKDGGVPDLPILMFASNGQGTGWNEDEWLEIQNNYIEELEVGKVINLESSHYVHDIEYERIAQEIEKHYLILELLP